MGTQAYFTTKVLNAIQNGDGVNMPSPFGMTGEGGIFASGTDPQIFIFSPKSASGAGLQYNDYVGQVSNLLTGSGAPFAGVPVTTQGYTRMDANQAVSKFNGKVLVQYDNNQVDDEDNPPATQQAIWRVWLENKSFQSEWDATPAQVGGTPCLPGANRKRDGSSCAPLSGSVSGSNPTASFRLPSPDFASKSGSSVATTGSQSHSSTSPSISGTPFISTASQIPATATPSEVLLPHPGVTSQPAAPFSFTVEQSPASAIPSAFPPLQPSVSLHSASPFSPAAWQNPPPATPSESTPQLSFVSIIPLDFVSPATQTPSL